MDGGQRDEDDLLDPLHGHDRFGRFNHPDGNDAYAYDVYASSVPRDPVLVGPTDATSAANATTAASPPTSWPPQSQPFPLLPDDHSSLADPAEFGCNRADDHPPSHSDAIAFTAADLMAASPITAARPMPNGLPTSPPDDQQPLPRHRQRLYPSSASTATAHSNGLRSGRSVSSPTTAGSTHSTTGAASRGRPIHGVAGSSSTSVKDLKKRFDQINAPSGASSTAASRPTRPSAAARSRSSTATSTSATAPANTSSTRAKTPTASRTHAAQQQQSAVSPNSFASRIAKPRTASGQPSPQLISPRAAARLATPSSPPPPPPPASASRLTGLLFGEILPENVDMVSVGYGIDSVSGINSTDPAGRPRRTSESIIQGIPRAVSRSYSEMDANGEPDSPTEWYRTAAGPSSTTRNTPTHLRTHSDTVHPPSSIPLPSSRPLPARILTSPPLSGLPSHRSHSAASLPQSPTSPTSRIPVSVRKLSSASNCTTSSSSRSDSPSYASRRTPVAAKTPRQATAHNSAGSASNATTPKRRAVTPSTSPPSLSTRPPPSSSSRKAHPSHITTAHNGNTSNNHLSAYVSVPPPKLSPPLRSSRPRQPVSSAAATAASSVSSSRLGRLSAASSSSSSIDRGRMQYASSTAASAARQEQNSRAARRKIDVGPIDFAQRRETIRLKYSKSIRETEAVAARQAAAEKRKKELEAAARAKAQAEAAVRAASSNAASPTTDTFPKRSRTPTASRGPSPAPPSTEVPPVPALPAVPPPATAPPSSPITAAAAPAPDAAGPPSLSITTDALAQQPAETEQSSKVGRGSPALVIPGTFPDAGPPPVEVSFNPLSLLGLPHEEAPPSATSQHSVETEFDNEPQTEPALPERAPPSPPKQQHADAPSRFDGSVPERSHYESPFDRPLAEDGAGPGLGLSLSPNDVLAEQPRRQHEKAVYQYPFEDDGTDDAASSVPDRPLRGHAKDKEGSFSFAHPIPGAFRQDSFDSRTYTPSPQDSEHGKQELSHGHERGPLVQSPARMHSLPQQSPSRHAGRDAETTGDSYASVDDKETALPEVIEIGLANETADFAPSAGPKQVDEIDPIPLPAPQNDPSTVAPEYEPNPFQPNAQQTTSVVIIGRETAEFPAHHPSLPHAAQSLCSDDKTPSPRPEDFYAGPSLRDNIAALRSSAFAAGDSSDGSERMAQTPSEHQHTPDTANSLAIPALPSPANRSSQQSGWTDFSVESADARILLSSVQEPASSADTTYGGHMSQDKHPSPAAAGPRLGSGSHPPHHQHSHRPNPYQFDSRPDSIIEEDASDNADAREETAATAQNVQGTESRFQGTGRHQLLPELDIQPGTSFFLPYLSEEEPPSRSPIPELPDHSPPPIPVSASNRDSIAASSAYYDSSRPNSFALGIHDDHETDAHNAYDGHGDHDNREARDGQGKDATAVSSSTAATAQPPERTSIGLKSHSMSGTTLIDSERPSTGRAADAPRPSGDGASAGANVAASSSSSSRPDSVKHQAAATAAAIAAAAPSKDQARLVQRQMVIRELIDTEAVFVRDMNIVEEIYKGTAEACPQLDANTVKQIFRNSDEIIAFHTAFLIQLKEAVSSVYAPKGARRPSPPPREDSILSEAGTLNSASNASVADTASSFTTGGTEPTLLPESDDARDRRTAIGPVFRENIDQMRVAHEGFLRSSDSAAKRLIQIQEDPTVKLWLAECNEVAQDLTAAWNLDSLLIKPMQRITKYPNLISQLLQYTPDDHPDRAALVAARTVLETAILDINKTKKNFELVGQIVGRKRKDSDVRAGLARAFGKRVDKLQASSNRPPEDAVYLKLYEKHGDDYLRLQVVLRDVEFYTRQVTAYVHEFLQLLSAMELVMRLQPSPYPELESKWARFNVSMRDMEKVALGQHLAQVRKHVIEPFELVIKCYENPGLAMKKRAKRRLDYERAVQLKKAGKKVDKQLAELVEQYEALNEALKKELPQLSANTERIGNICLGNLVNIQVRWFAIWKDKVRTVLEDQPPGAMPPTVADIVSSFTRDFQEVEDHVKQNLTLLARGGAGAGAGAGRAGRASDDTGRSSFSPSLVGGTSMLRSRSGQPASTMPTTSHSTSALASVGSASGRLRDGSLASDGGPPTLPAPDFGRRHSGGHFPPPLSSPLHATTATAANTTTATTMGMPSSPNHQYYYSSYRNDYYGGIQMARSSSQTGRSGSGGQHVPGPAPSPMSPGLPTTESMSSRRSVASSNGGGLGAGGYSGGRPGTGRSYDSSAPVRPSMDSSLTGSAGAGGTNVRPSMDSALSGSSSYGGPPPPARLMHTNNATPGLSALVAAGAAAAGVGAPVGWRDSSSTYNSNYQYAPSVDGGRRRFSGLFQSALPLDDSSSNGGSTQAAPREPGERAAAADDGGGRSSLGVLPSRDRTGTMSSATSSSFAAGGQGDGGSSTGVLWLAASLFEFNIETKHEAGYPYLTYQAGEIFDVIAEKGELWLAKNQDDANDVVGWIWSKHFAKLADS